MIKQSVIALCLSKYDTSIFMRMKPNVTIQCGFVYFQEKHLIFAH